MYQFFPQLILRTPVYTVDKYKAANLQQLLTDLYFQVAIFLASPTLYEQLEKTNFDEKTLSPKVLFTLRKYLNRMCFRPTPFGLFSGVALTDWSKENYTPALIHGETFSIKTALSYGEGIRQVNELHLQELAPYHTYRSNTSIYRVEDELRFVRYESDSASGKRHFFVASVGYSGFLQSLFRYCQLEKSKEAIIRFIRKSLTASEEESCVFFDQLTEQQLLLSTLEANITGEDYLQRLVHLCESLQLDTPRISNLRFLRDKLESVSSSAGKEKISSAILALGQASHLFRKAKSPLYVNLDLGKAVGGLDIAYQSCLVEGLECLNRLLPTQQPRGLEHFAGAFGKKFEGRAMPLLLALDPEVGVGYEELASGYSSPRLLWDIELTKDSVVNPTIAWTPAHALLLGKWQGRSGPKAAIHLSKQDLEQLPAESRPGKLPPTTSVLFRVNRDKVYIEQAGGASATALLGRFTPLNEDISKMANALAEQEQNANSHVIFAEIAHTSDTHTANIDRRRGIRDFEIPVLVESTLPLDRQISLSDLWVKVEEGEVILFSKKLQKVIVPRLSSAFNYVRDDLAVFRFLCDLQYQGLKASFTLDLRSFFPGMCFYPRVAFESTVLHLATWYLEREQFAFVLEGTGEQGLLRLRELAAKLGWPRYIALTEHDHQLVVDLQQENDLILFIKSIRKKQQVVVKEFPFVDETAPIVADKTGKPFVHQFLTALFHGQEVYPAKKLPLKALQETYKGKRKLLPGNEWLYFKIYCHPSRANHILTDMVLPVINSLQRQGDVQQWFYVRYRDPEYHVRVRLSVSPEQAGKAMNALHQKLSRQVKKGVVRDVQLCIYERELERYGPAFMAATESFFCASSALVANSIKKLSDDETDYAYYRVGFAGLEAIANAFTVNLVEKTALFASMYESFYREFAGNKTLREQLSATYRSVSSANLMPASSPDAFPEDRVLRKLWQKMQLTLQGIAQKAALLSHDRKVLLVADLMHMHLNRVFVDEPRKQELVAYYCLWRHHKSLLARRKA